MNDPQDYAGQKDGIGFALYAKAMHVVMTDFTAVDCARDQAKNAAVFFGWINELGTNNGNLSIAKFRPSNLGAFSVCYVGRTTEYDSRWLSVKHTNHYVQGFTCQYVYHAMLHEGICNHELTQIDVIDTSFSGQACAVFYAQDGKVYDWRRSKLKLNKCQVINVENSDLGAFCKFDLGDSDIEKTECRCNIAEWADITQTADYSPYVDPIVVECDYEPPTTQSDTESILYTDETLESDTEWQSSLESKDDEKDPEDQSDKKGSPLSAGAIVGIVLAILILIAIIIVILFLLRRRRLSSSGSENSDKEHEMEETETSATANTTWADPASVASTNYNQTQLNQIFQESDDEFDNFEEEF